MSVYVGMDGYVNVIYLLEKKEKERNRMRKMRKMRKKSREGEEIIERESKVRCMLFTLPCISAYLPIASLTAHTLIRHR